MRELIALGAAGMLIVGGSIPVAAQTATARPVDTPLCLVVRAAPDIDLENPVVVQTQIATGAIEVTDVVPCDGAAEPTAAPPAGDTGMWVVGDIETDPLTDAPTAVLSLDASSGANAFGNAITLVIRCSNGDTELYAVWGDYLGSDTLVSVDTRVGDDEVSHDLWSSSTDNTATFYWGDVVPFVRRLMAADRLVLKTTPYNASPVTAVFDLAGMENALANVREACDW